MTANVPTPPAVATTTRVYLAAAVQGRMGVGLSYEWFARALEDAGGSVVNAEVAAPIPDDLEQRFAAPLIYEVNTAKLRSADILVAECSVPSLGVGYEIAIAETCQLPIVCFWRTGASPLSKMILGSPYPKLRVFEYSTEEDVRQLMRLALNALCVLKDSDHRRGNRNELLHHFEVLAPDYDTSADWRRANPLLAWFQHRLPSDGTIVDVGSGTGAILSGTSPGLRVVRIDLSEAMLRRCDVGHAILADAHAMPLAERIADAVTLRQVLHYTDEGTCLSEISRILRPGGRLLIAQIVAVDDRTRRWWMEVKRMVQPLRRTFYSESHILGILASTGFVAVERDVIELVRSDPWERFFAHTPPQLHAAVRDFLERTPSDLRDRLELELSASGISYRQRWYLMACISRQPGSQQ